MHYGTVFSSKDAYNAAIEFGQRKACKINSLFMTSCLPGAAGAKKNVGGRKQT